MAPLTLEQRITHLQSAIYTLRILRNEGVDLTTTIEQAECKLHELQKQAGWHCVSPIRNGSATDSIFCGTLENCQEYVSIWLEAHPEDKGNIIISPL